MTYDALEQRIIDWARAQSDIRAVIVCGSRARKHYPADEWSDLDCMILTTKRPGYAADSDWLANFGDLWLTYLDLAADTDPEWFAIFEGGLKTDFVLLQVEDSSLDLPVLLALYPYQGVFGRGVRVLYDQHDPQSSYVIPARPVVLPKPPTPQQFDKVVNGFLLEAAKTAKFIRRGDLWRSMKWFTDDLRTRLLTMIEWHAYGRDTWYGGRFIEEWSDARVLAALPDTFPQYTQASMKRALLAIMALFRLISREVADRFGFSYPAADEKIVALVETILSSL